MQDISYKLGVLHGQLARDLVARLDEIDGSALARQVSAEFEVDLKRPELGNQGAGLSSKTRKAVAEAARKAAKAVSENPKQVTEVLPASSSSSAASSSRGGRSSSMVG